MLFPLWVAATGNVPRKPASTLQPARDRAATEARLLEATRTILERDGVLSGLNLKEVSEVSGVNRGLIYHYFGSRQGLLRRALGAEQWFGAAVFSDEARQRSFQENRVDAFHLAVERRQHVHLEALLAIDRDEGAQLFPRVESIRRFVASSIERGELPSDLDEDAMYLVTSAMVRGWAIFRDAFSREFDRDAEQLDREAARVLARMITKLAPSTVSSDVDQEPS